MKNEINRALVAKKKLIVAMMLCFTSILALGQEVIVDTTSISNKDIIILGGNENASNASDPTCVYSNGMCMNFPKAGLTGVYNPALGWSIAQCTMSDGTSIMRESMILITTASDTYYSFDADSRILIRFSDQSMVTLYRDLGSRIETKYENMWMGNTLMKFYRSYVRFQLDSETRSKFLNPALGIVKIRIVFTNGNIRDYELTGKRIMKFPEELRESYQQAMKGNAQKIHNSDDSTF